MHGLASVHISIGTGLLCYFYLLCYAACAVLKNLIHYAQCYAHFIPLYYNLYSAFCYIAIASHSAFTGVTKAW